ncbi:MAG: L-lactate permease, partial [Candidatus Thermoplasmatota archaeon]|nr:L-lactate permease [Candidatus Thermoplasmatota archaeon]
MDLLILLALLPVILALILLVIFVYPAIKVMPVVWAFTLLLVALVWRMPPNALIAANIKGLEGALEIVLILFGALLLLYVLEESGALSVITKSLASISEDSRVQAVIVGFLFVSLLESCAGFGVPAAVAAPILYMLGFPPVAAVVIALIGNMPSVTFGGLGVPILVSYGKTLDIPEVVSSLNYSFEQMLINVGFWSATFHALVGFFIPFMMCLVLTKFWGNKRAKDALGAWKFCFFVGGSFFIPYWLFSFLGPELPTIGASIISLPLVMYTSSKGFLMPKKVWRVGEKKEEETKREMERGERKKNMSVIRAWSPYIGVVAILIITRIPAIYDAISSVTFSWNNALGSG